jgi:hypothetical protein
MKRDGNWEVIDRYGHSQGFFKTRAAALFFIYSESPTSHTYCWIDERYAN